MEGVASPRALCPSPEKRLLCPKAQQVGLWKVICFRHYPRTETEKVEKIEEIQNQVAKDGLSESYFESGPQALGCIEEY